MSGCDWVCYMQYVVYVPILLAGVPLNLAALWKLLKLRQWRESTVYLLNLIINDTLLLFSLPFKIHAYGKVWGLSPFFCSLLESLFYVNVYGSIMLSVCIAGDRYVSLRFPFAARRLRSPRKAALICSLIWVLVFSCSFPVYKFHKDNKSFCFQNFSNSTWTESWIVVSMETVFCCSAVIMMFCSVQVVRILGELRKRNPMDPKLRNNKSAKIVLSNLLVFLICFIPYHIAAVLYFLYKNKEGQPDPNTAHLLRTFVHSTLCLSSMNCLADGACYYFILKENLHSAEMERTATINITHTRDILGNADCSLENGSDGPGIRTEWN